MRNDLLASLAKKYDKDIAQIILRFEVQDGVIPLPKSVRPQHIAGNLKIFDFELTDEEMEAIRGLDTGKGQHDPDAPGVGEALLKNYRIHD